MKSAEHTFESTIEGGISGIENTDFKNAGSIAKS
jgi:hypothetical protein